MFTLETLSSSQSEDASFRITKKAEEMKWFLEQVSYERDVLRENILHSLGRFGSPEMLTEEGLTALARASVAASEGVFPVVRTRGLQELTHPGKGNNSKLTQESATNIWLDEEAVQMRRRNRGRVSPKISVLRYIFNNGYVEADPAITRGELYDIVCENRVFRRNRLILRFANVLQRRYEEPPYLYMFAQFILHKTPQAYQEVFAALYNHSPSYAFIECGFEQQSELACLYTEHLRSGTPLSELVTKEGRERWGVDIIG